MCYSVARMVELVGVSRPENKARQRVDGPKRMLNFCCICLKMQRAVSDVAQWTECQPTNCEVASLNPSQGTCLGCGPGPQLGVGKWEQMHVSLTH